MKRLLFALATLISMQAGAQLKSQNQFVIKGHLTGINEGLLYLSYRGLKGTTVKDSASLKNSTFLFNGEIDIPTIAFLTLKEDKRNGLNSTSIFIEPTAMKINLKINEFSHATVKGSKTQTEFFLLQQSKNHITEKYKKQLDSLQTEKDHTKNAEIRERLAPYFREIYQKDFVFFDKNPKSYITAYLLKYHINNLTINALQQYYDRLGKEMQQTPDGKLLADEITKLRGGSVGSIAKNFTAIDYKGNKLSLSDFKGRYILLDFWATWCVPCRKSFPHLKELYAKYKDHGLEIICIADDDRKPELWKEVIESDSLNMWHHVLRGFDINKRMKNEKNENEINDKFGIHSLPTKILIDPNGVIIGRYGGGGENEEELDRKTAEIFNSNKL